MFQQPRTPHRFTNADDSAAQGHLVTLKPYEFADCVGVALRRLMSSEERGLNHASTYRRGYLERMEQEIVGACGERAYAKLTNQYYDSSVDTFHHQADVGASTEVRATTRTDGCLIVRDNDASDRTYVLVTGEPPTMRVCGWITGAQAKQDAYRRDPRSLRPAWFVPQDALKPIPWIYSAA